MKILLAVDDSIYSEAAIDALLSRMWPTQSRFKVVSVLDEMEASTPAHFGSAGAPSAISFGAKMANEVIPATGASVMDGLQAVEQMLKRVSAQLEQNFPDADVTYELLYGNSKDQILDSAAKWSADLIVVGSHGRTGLTRFLLGSVSQTLLLYGQCSTLVVRRPQAGPELKESKVLAQKILIPLDLSEHSRKALDWVTALPWGAESQFKILTVMPPLAEKFSDGFDLLQGESMSIERLRLKKEGQQLLEESKIKLSQKFGTERVSGEMLEGDAADIILTTAKSWSTSLIVMGTHGHGWLKRLWLGSVSQEIVLQAPCSVEVVKGNLATT